MASSAVAPLSSRIFFFVQFTIFRWWPAQIPVAALGTFVSVLAEWSDRYLMAIYKTVNETKSEIGLEARR
jgi:hypothetical protein